MCGPSSALKSINQDIQGLAQSMTGEAKKVFGTIDTTVNKILSSVGSIISGGPSAGGMNQAELNARRAQAVEAGGTEARNIRGLVGSTGAAVGGGAAPNGVTAALLAEGEQRAAADTATAQNAITQENYAVGRDNYWKATQAAESAPGMYNTANAFNNSAMQGENAAMTSQQNIDTQKGWWKPLIMKLGTGLLGAATGGVSSAITSGVGSLFGGGANGGGSVLDIGSNSGSMAGAPNPFSLGSGTPSLSNFPSIPFTQSVPNFTGATGVSGGGIGA